MNSTQGVSIKLGWLTDDDNKPKGMDERYFNQEYRKLGLPGPDRAYTRNGWNWDNKIQRVSPYTRTAKENRLMLAFDRSSLEVVNDNRPIPSPKIASRALANMTLIVSNFEKLFGEVDNQDMWRDNSEASNRSFIAIPPAEQGASGTGIDLTVMCGKADRIRKMCF